MKSHAMQQIGLCVLLLASGAVLAQSPAPAAPAPAASTRMGPGAGPGYGAGYQARHGAGPAASGAMGHGGGMRGARMARAGSDVTPGWALMTQAERDQHRAQIAAAKSLDECTALVAQHREQIAARAKEQGKALKGPKRDACASFKS